LLRGSAQEPKLGSRYRQETNSPQAKRKEKQLQKGAKEKASVEEKGEFHAGGSHRRKRSINRFHVN